MIPVFRVKSSDIYTFDHFYEAKLAVDQDVLKCGFAKLYVVDREEVDEATFTEKLSKLKVENYTQYVSQPENSKSGIFNMRMTSCKARTFKEFQKLVTKETELSKGKPIANIRKFVNEYFTPNEKRTGRYGYIYNKSLFCNSSKKINLSMLVNPIDAVHNNQNVYGVNGPMILIGGDMTCFPWHDEDCTLASINFLHFGDNKIWIIIHVESSKKFREDVTKEFARYEKQTCSNPLAHKCYLTTLQWLDEHQIKYSIVSQEVRSYIVVLPGVFHMGFNTGLNISEARNFVCSLWSKASESRKNCDCGCVKNFELKMEAFKHSGFLTVAKEIINPDPTQNQSEPNVLTETFDHYEDEYLNEDEIENVNESTDFNMANSPLVHDHDYASSEPNVLTETFDHYEAEYLNEDEIENVNESTDFNMANSPLVHDHDYASSPLNSSAVKPKPKRINSILERYQSHKKVFKQYCTIGKCALQPRLFLFKCRYDEHMLSHNDPQLTCDICGKSIRHKRNLNKHKKLFHRTN